MQLSKYGSHSLQENQLILYKKQTNKSYTKKTLNWPNLLVHIYSLNAFSLSCLYLDMESTGIACKFQTSITTT